jgi:disulfide bond formation protein DsbB
MCIVQRYAMTGIAMVALLGGLLAYRLGGLCADGLGNSHWPRAARLLLHDKVGCSGTRLKLQSCGRDFYGMVESFPLQRAIPMIFRGSGDCTKVGLDLLRRLYRQLVICGFCWHSLVAWMVFAVFASQLH